MMLGYGIVNSMAQLVVRPIADKISAGDRRNEMNAQLEAKHKLDLEVLQLNKELELLNNFNLQDYSHHIREQEAQSQFDKQLQMWQLGQFNSTMWPLLTPFDHPSLHPKHSDGRLVPINVFMAKTDPRSPFAALLQSDVKNRLSNFLQTTYSNSGDHPCICRIGDWKDGFQDAAFINALWYGLQGQPCIVINPIQSEFGELLDLNVSLWGLASMGFAPITQTVISGPFASAIGKLKRAETLKWIESGLPCDSPDMQHNVKLIGLERQLKMEGKPTDVIEQLLIQYKLPKEIQNNVINAFSREYSHMVACITGMFTDIYHLVEYGTAPYMPEAINQYNLSNGQNYQIPNIAISHYRKALTDLTCTNYLQDRLPKAYLNVAQAIRYNNQMAHEVFQDGVGVWLNRKEDSHADIPTDIEGCVRMLRDNADERDSDYLTDAKRVLLTINEADAARELDSKIYTLGQLAQAKKDGVTADLYYEVSEWGTYSFDEFKSYATSSASTVARYAVCHVFSMQSIIAFHADSDYRIISSIDNPVHLIITDKFSLTPTQTSLFEERWLVYDLLTNQFITKSNIMPHGKSDAH